MPDATLSRTLRPTDAELHAMSLDELIGVIEQALEMTVLAFQMATDAWKQVVKMGHESVLERFRTSRNLIRWVPHIAGGSVAAEAVLAFAGSPIVFRAIKALPPEKQKELAGGGLVEVAVQSGGEFTKRLIAVNDMIVGQLKQVFNDGVIRTLKQQQNLLSTPVVPTKRIVTAGRVVVDRKTQKVTIGTNTAAVEDVVKALREAGFIKTA